MEEDPVPDLRRAEGPSPEVLMEIHKRLGAVSIRLPRDSTPQQLRAIFSDVREHRNAVQRILSSLLPRLALLRADLIRIERSAAGEGSRRLRNNVGFMGAETATARQERLKWHIRRWLDAKAEVRADLALIEEVVSHAKMVREELKFAFEEASRALSSIELEYRIERSAP